MLTPYNNSAGTFCQDVLVWEKIVLWGRPDLLYAEIRYSAKTCEKITCLDKKHRENAYFQKPGNPRGHH